jgi:ribonuclease HII
MASDGTIPSLVYERRFWEQGYRCVAGLDEAGRGAWAGPVVAAAVVLPSETEGIDGALAGVRDSKRLSARRREQLFDTIQERALAVGVGVVPPTEIDACGIVPATRQAMSLALGSLSTPADSLLIDYLALPELVLPQESITKGDALVLSIAAASIIAKVSRDRLMVDLEPLFPGYGFARHKGYGTPQHREALSEMGASDIHRLSFEPLRRLRVGHETSTS